MADKPKKPGTELALTVLRPNELVTRHVNFGAAHQLNDSVILSFGYIDPMEADTARQAGRAAQCLIVAQVGMTPNTFGDWLSSITPWLTTAASQLQPHLDLDALKKLVAAVEASQKTAGPK